MLKIFIDRLKDGDTETIFESIEPAFLQEEPELFFPSKIVISGQAYLAKNHLILQLKLKTTIRVPCAICNEKIELPLQVDDLYVTEELCELPSAVYDYTEEVKYALLLKVPQFAQCNEGSCPQRHQIKKYSNTAKTNHPFAEL